MQIEAQTTIPSGSLQVGGWVKVTFTNWLLFIAERDYPWPPSPVKTMKWIERVMSLSRAWRIELWKMCCKFKGLSVLSIHFLAEKRNLVPSLQRYVRCLLHFLFSSRVAFVRSSVTKYGYLSSNRHCCFESCYFVYMFA